MKRICTFVLAALVSLGSATACMKKSASLAMDTTALWVGYVMDTTQALLPQAEVIWGDQRTTTSWDGRFVFRANGKGCKASKLEVKCEGYKTQKIALRNVDFSQPMTVALEPVKRKDTGRPTGILMRGKSMHLTGAARTADYSMAPMEDGVMYSLATAEMAESEHMPRPVIPEANDVTAGKLTAGEVNDYAKWYFWPRVLDGTHKQYASEWAVSPRHRYTVQLTNTSGHPVASRSVSLLDQAGNTLFQAVTDNTGKAELWYQLLGNNLCGKHTDFYIRVDDRKQVARPWSEGLNYFVVDEPCETSDAADVLFVFDATGSMGDELRYLQAEMKDVISRAKEATGGLTIRTGAVVYRDHGDEYLTRISRLTEDIRTTQYFIDKQEANGGGDYPEAVPEALMAALNSAGWDSNARARIAFLILDAPCHQDSTTVALLHEQILNAAALGVRVVPVVCSGLGESGELLMRSVALATNGTSFFLTDDSGIGNPHLKPTTDSLKVEHLNDMLVRTIVEFSTMPECNDDSQNEPNDELTDVQFIPNPFEPEDLKEDENTIPHGRGIHYLVDVTGKLITVFEGSYDELSLSSKLPKGVYFIKTYADGKWYTKKVLIR